jgi:hypothetical protein
VLLAHRVHPRIGPRLAGAGAQSLSVEALRDPVVGKFLRQLAQARHHPILGAPVPAQGRAAHLVPGGCSAAPDHGNLGTSRPSVDAQRDLCHHQPQQALAVHVVRGRGSPERRQVLSQALHGLPVGLVQRQQLGPAHECVFLFELLERFQGRVPAGL